MQEMNLLKAQAAFTSFLVELAELREKNRLVGLELIQARQAPAILDKELGTLRHEARLCSERQNRLQRHLEKMPKISRSKVYIQWLKDLDILINGFAASTLHL